MHICIYGCNCFYFRAKAAAFWTVVQQRHSRLQCANTVNVKLQLLQSIFMPSVHYGCDLWGMRMHSCRAALDEKPRTDLEQIYSKYLRHI